MTKTHTLLFLLFSLFVVPYMLYDISKENKKIYNLLHDQDATIQLQSKAFEYQSIYIKQMEYRYSKSYHPINRSPIH